MLLSDLSLVVVGSRCRGVTVFSVAVTATTTDARVCGCCVQAEE